MKKQFRLLMLCIGISSYIHSQTNSIAILDSSKMTAQRWRDTCFALLNLSASQISSGYLLDYSIAAFNDSNFNSLISSKTDTISDAGNFFSLHNILTSSVVNSNAVSIGNTDSFFINAYRYQRNTGNIPLLFLYQPYQKIAKTALSQGLFTITPDSLRLKDVAGRPSSPYYNDYFFAFSPFKNKINVFGNISFALPSQFWLMPGVTSVQVDFGDGIGYRTLSQNSTVSIYYPASGTYYMNAKITTAAGTLLAKSSIQYTRPKFYINPDSVWNISVAPLYSNIQNSVKAQGAQPLGSGDPCSSGSIFDMANCDINPGAQVQIVNGCDHVFDKPIIVVEGFDPTGIVTFGSLQQYVENSYSTTSTNFFSTMRQAGYDFVFVIFTKNTDNIENNAMVLEQVIQRVNSAKTGTNKSSVIGFSMGGLIARYALRDMEIKGISHQVANYFSYDSPHQGANVPLGLQYLFKEMLTDMPFLKYIPDVGSLYSSFTSTAAQQMLATYATGSNGSQLTNARSNFAQDLINVGYPLQTTANYGISQGRGNNTSGTTNAGVGTQFGFANGGAIFDGSITAGVENMSATVNAVSTTSYATILRYNFFGIKVIYLFHTGASIGSYATVRSRNIKYQSAYPYDDAPGGYERTQAQFQYSFNKLLFYPPATDHGHYGHCFVPLASALDLQNQGYGSSNSFQSNNMYYALDNNVQSPGQLTGNTLSPSTLSPFKNVLTYTSDCSVDVCQSNCSDDVYLSVNNVNQNEGANWNEWHEGDFSNQAQLFIQRKILGTGTFPACSINTDFCSSGPSSPQITGPAYFCTTAIYNLSNSYPIQGVTYQWSSTNGYFAVTGGQGTPTITISKVGNGNDVLKLVITNSCGLSTNYIYNVAVGAPAPTVNVTLDCPEGSASAINAPGALPNSYTWHLVTPPPTGGETINSNWSSVINYHYLVGTHNIGATYVNACGTSDPGVVYGVYCPNGVGGHGITVSPNPSTGNVTISAASDASPQLQANAAFNSASSKSKTVSAQGKIYQIKVLGQSGNLLKQFSYPSGITSTNINLSSFANGVYILQIYDNVSWTNQQVVIMK